MLVIRSNRNLKLTILCMIAVQPVEGKEDPCGGNFCGPYSTQRVQGNRCICSCLQSYFGFPPNCRPECVVSSDCSQNLACLSQKCKDPCPGRCGVNARCHVVSHHPICTCPPEYEGDPFTSCQRTPCKGKIKPFFLTIKHVLLFSYSNSTP